MQGLWFGDADAGEAEREEIVGHGHEGFVGRQAPWAQTFANSFRDGRVCIDLGDIGAPKAVFHMQSWPPQDLDKDLRRAAKDQAA